MPLSTMPCDSLLGQQRVQRLGHQARPFRDTRLTCAAALTAGDTKGSLSRRSVVLLVPLISAAAALTPTSYGAEAPVNDSIQQLQRSAFNAYADRDFGKALRLLNTIVEQQPNVSRWYEMRAQVLVDNKEFNKAIADYEAALQLSTGAGAADTARLIVGRALGYEGLGDWRAALQDYNAAIQLAEQAGLQPDPYVINSRGNCYNSLGQWDAARQDYRTSADIFQSARGMRGRNGATTQRLDGAVFAFSNAALMQVQLGDEDGALSEMVRIARRAPGSADMHAALAALYWDRGQQRQAEEQWEYACDQVSVGCRNYQDQDWLRRIRRWPPIMVAKMSRFLKMQSPA